MRFLTVISVMGLMLAGCATENTPKVDACEGSNDKNCSSVVYFLPDSDEVSPYGKLRLDWSIQKLEKSPEKKALITAYAYEAGGDAYNMELSKRRARSVGQYMVQEGIDPGRIRVRYRGNKEPVCFEPECQKQNRRTVVELYSL